MLETYKAKIFGDKIEWETDQPKILQTSQSVAVFVTILEADSEIANLRPFGLGAGEFVVPEDFDAPLPKEFLAAFEQ